MTTDIISILALSIGLAALLAAVAIIIYIVRWKTAFVIEDGDKRFQLVPDDVISRNTSELKKQRKVSKRIEKFHTELAQKALSDHEEIGRAVISSNEELRKAQRRTFEAHQLTLAATKSLQEETKILRSEIQTQAAELERHRKGYDVDILCVALIPVARMHHMIQQDLSRSDLSDEARATLEALEDEHLGILETRGVKLVEPAVGSLYRDQKNIKHPPDSVPATDQSVMGTIKSVSSPAYELETSARNVVLLEAEVVVYSAPKEQSEVTVELEDASKEGSDNG
ncbi:hypothetical protein ACFL1V_07550 [Pseudomonadota bacterium]